MVLEVNTKVWAVYNGHLGKRKYYSGKIVTVNEDQTYKIHVSEAHALLLFE